MHISALPSRFVSLLLCLCLFPASCIAVEGNSTNVDHPGVLEPKVFIISMFTPEAQVWWDDKNMNILAQNITVPGFDPLYPDVHCTADGQICNLITGEAEINAASTLSALIYSKLFNLRRTYFLIGGIAGVSPKAGTLASVAFARFAVQVALQYEIDAREVPANFSTGYVPQGAKAPGEYPPTLYGTEVFELNTALRDWAVRVARTAKLEDSAEAAAYRAKYAASAEYAAKGAGAPGVETCDVATSDTFWHGRLLAEGFEGFTKLMTNGSGAYCMTDQEDNATLTPLLRAAALKPPLTDFSRIIILRTASNFDRPPPGIAASTELFYINQGGFEPSLRNIYNAGLPVVNGIVAGWNEVFAAGLKRANYVGDIFGTLGWAPDFGPGAGNDNPITKRGVRGMKRGMMGRMA